MKCGRCRVSNALSYTKITEGHQLFEALKSVLPEGIYNDKRAYFCGSCIDLATNKFRSFNESSLTDQNANSLSLKNSSFAISNVSSKDEYDLLVAPKIVYSDTGSLQFIRPTLPSRIGADSKRRNTTSESIAFKTKPCPKRFKKQLTTKSNDAISSIPERNIPESTHDRVTSSQNSETVSETDLLLNIQPDNADDYKSSEEIDTRDASVKPSRTVETVIRPTSPLSDNVSHSRSFVSNENANVSNVGEQGFEAQSQIVSTHISSSESDQPLSHLQQGIAGPSAPAVRDPRIRQPNIDLLRNDDLRRYFQQNEQAIDVNHYSRLTAG